MGTLGRNIDISEQKTPKIVNDFATFLNFFFHLFYFSCTYFYGVLERNII